MEYSAARSVDAGYLPDLLGWDSAMLKNLQSFCPINDGGNLTLLILMGLYQRRHRKVKELHVRRHRPFPLLGQSRTISPDNGQLTLLVVILHLS